MDQEIRDLPFFLYLSVKKAILPAKG